jgi:YidC/Oxa1 family membrane protein insertase
MLCVRMQGIVLQGFTFASFFFGLKAMGEHYPTWSQGGTAWFTDLSTLDTTYVLPVITAVTFLATTEAAAVDSTDPKSAQMRMAMRALSVAMLPISATMPAGVLMYWITTNTFGTVQGLLMKQSAVRQALNLPPLSDVRSGINASAGSTVVNAAFKEKSSSSNSNSNSSNSSSSSSSGGARQQNISGRNVTVTPAQQAQAEHFKGICMYCIHTHMQ